MITIYAYILKVDSITKIIVRENSEILCIKSSNNLPFIYLKVDDKFDDFVERDFLCVETFTDISEVNGDYIGSVNCNCEVLHYFEVKK